MIQSSDVMPGVDKLEQIFSMKNSNLRGTKFVTHQGQQF